MCAVAKGDADRAVWLPAAQEDVAAADHMPACARVPHEGGGLGVRGVECLKAAAATGGLAGAGTAASGAATVAELVEIVVGPAAAAAEPATEVNI